MLALILTLPALKGNKDGITVAFTAVVSIGVIGLYIAYVIPIYLRWRMRRRVRARAVDAGQASTSGCASVAVIEVLIVVVIGFNLPFSASGVPWERRLRVVAVQLHAGRDGRRVRDRRDLVAGERRASTFKGPRHTVEDLDSRESASQRLG